VDDLDKVVDLVESQLRLRRACLSSSLRSLWRAAIYIETDEPSTSDYVMRKLQVCNKLEGHIAGQQLKKMVSLDQVESSA
jgi:hypothetical protein